MPLPIVSPALFNAHGLGATVDELHAQPGNHIRINSHPWLGLPVAPFVVWRGVAETDRSLQLRKSVTFRDKFGAVTAPFTLTPDNPVTATLVLGMNETCIWARVIADPIGSPGAGPNLGSFPGVVNPFTGILTGTEIPSIPGGVINSPFTRMDRQPGTRDAARAGGMLAEAFVSSVHGPASVGRRNTLPFTFSAPGIIEITLSGQAAVSGVEWLEAHDLPHVSFKPWSVLNLPHEGGPRYASVDSAVKRAVGRVFNQAPKRNPLQETLGATAPAAAPIATASDEQKRVESLFKPLMPDLDSLINDLSEKPFDQHFKQPVTDDTNSVIGEVDMLRLDRLNQGQFDPGVASFLGYKGLDHDFVEVEPALIFYWIDGYFRDFPALNVNDPAAPDYFDRQTFDSLVANLDGNNRFGNVADLKRRLISDIDRLPNVSLNKEKLTELEDHGDYIGLGTLLVVDRRAPLLPVTPPQFDKHKHIDWIPSELPPAARREVRLDLSGVVTGGLLAGEKQTVAASSTAEHLNSSNADGFYLPLALGMDINDETQEASSLPGTGFLADRQGEPDPIRYYVSQQDRFGRWSGWTSVVNEPGKRPKPPRPVLEAYYTQPADPASSPGTVRVRVAIPLVDALAPASFLLAGLQLDAREISGETGNPIGAVMSHPQNSLPAAPGPLDFTFPGLNLAPTERRKLKLVARWVDTAGEQSIDSEPVTLTMTDPRPPAQLSVPDVLLYSARPDITGLSMVEHTWTPLGGQAQFGIYYTDENRLRSQLENVADGDASSDEAALLVALDAAPDAAARATLYRNNAALFDGHLFERLDGAVMELASGERRFRHAVSGSLRVLNFYRLSAESDSNARVDLSTLPLLIYAVPNVDPPAQPVLQVKPEAIAANDGTYAVNITLSLVVMGTAGETYRLRRSAIGAGDPLRMPVVETGPIPAADDKGKQTTAITDAGPVLISSTATLKPWVRYHWIAEVQGLPAPGSGVGVSPLVPGLWSAASEPVSLVLTPPDAPAAVTELNATGVADGGGNFDGMVLTFEHPQKLLGGEFGYYRARIQRRLPEGDMQNLADVNVVGESPYTISGVDPGNLSESVPAGTIYRIVLIDPLGRESIATEAELT